MEYQITNNVRVRVRVRLGLEKIRHRHCLSEFCDPCGRVLGSSCIWLYSSYVMLSWFTLLIPVGCVVCRRRCQSCSRWRRTLVAWSSERTVAWKGHTLQFIAVTSSRLQFAAVTPTKQSSRLQNNRHAYNSQPSRLQFTTCFVDVTVWIVGVKVVL